jgi:hypothetical protein
MLRVYRIYKEKDANYESWYGTKEDIIKYLEEDVESHKDYDINNDFESNLILYGLIAEVVYAFEKKDLTDILIMNIFNKNMMTRLETQTFCDMIDIIRKRQDLIW